MIITDRTISILKNFSAINPSIVLKQGEYIHTVSEDGSLYAEASTTENFPCEVGIYRLKEFINLMTIDKKAIAKITFEEDHCMIKSGEAEVKYVYDDVSLINTPSGRPKEAEEQAWFFMEWADIKRIMSMTAALKYENITLTIEGGMAKFSAHEQNQHIDSSSVEMKIAEPVNCEANLEVQYTLRLEHFKKLIQSDYMVRVYDGRRVMFGSDNKVDYHMIAKKDSTMRIL